MLEYKGYVGTAEYDPDDNNFHGRVINLERDGITFVGRSVDELQRELVASVEAHLDFCREHGIEPERPEPAEVAA